MNWKPIDHLLLIDNDDINNFIIEELFKEANVTNRLSICTGVTEALEFLEKEEDKPNLILLDLNMPVLGGFDFLKEYMARGYDKFKTKVIVLSSSLNVKIKSWQRSIPV